MQKLKKLSLFLVILQVTLCAQANPFLRKNQKKLPFLVIAHRGARAFAPENTLCAFKKAIQMRAHVVEMDVHLTKDGIPIILHDDTLVRCSDVRKKFPKRKSYFVSDFTLKEIKTLDAGSWFSKAIRSKWRPWFLKSLTKKEEKKYISKKDLEYYASGKITHPTLQETLLFLKKERCLIKLEIKSMPRFYPGITEKVIHVIEKTGMENRVIISCFDHNNLVLCKKRNPRIATAMVSPGRMYKTEEYCIKKLNADAYHIRYSSLMPGIDSIPYASNKMLKDPLIENATKNNIGVYAWTVNDMNVMRILKHSGVSGVITDYPNRLIQVLKSK